MLLAMEAMLGQLIVVQAVAVIVAHLAVGVGGVMGVALCVSGVKSDVARVGIVV